MEPHTDVPLAVSSSGPKDGRPVVLLHSLATSSAMWAFQVPIWSQRLHVLNVDLPGHGRAPAAAGRPTFSALAHAVWALLDRHGIAEPSVVGLSLGGMIAQAMAIERPDRIRALVLAHTLAASNDGVRRVWDERIAQVEATGMDGQVTGTIERWFTPAFRASSPLTIRWIAGLIRATDAASFVAAGRAIQSLDHLDGLAAIRSPTLIVAGAHDPGAPVAAAEAMAAQLPSSELQVLESSHLGNVEQAARFTEIVGAFLER